MKVCSKCKVEKELSEFSKDKHKRDGLRPSCKVCKNKQNLDYSKTVRGLITRIYGHQKQSSKHRGHVMPDYSKDELKEWILSQSNFQELYDNWVKSDYYKMLKPSCDRDKNNLPYTLDNLTLMTWKENEDKGRESVRKPVLQFTKEGEFIKEFNSQIEAEIETSINNSNISACCRGIYKHAGGFIWKHKE